MSIVILVIFIQNIMDNNDWAPLINHCPVIPPGGGLGSVLGLWPLGSQYLVLSRPGRTEVLRGEESGPDAERGKRWEGSGVQVMIYLVILHNWLVR